MLRAAWFCAGLVLAPALCLSTQAQSPPRTPYVDPTQLEVPWPKHSFARVPWRGFLETKRGVDFVRGVGVNYNVPGQCDLAVRLLAEAGFKTFRIETGWGGVQWDEKGVNEMKRLRWLLGLCRTHEIRPTLLLNAHHGVPCPHRVLVKRLAADTPQGGRRVKLADVREVVAGRTGISNQSDYWGAEVLITKVDEGTGACELSKPLPKALKQGQELRLMTLKYLPLYPVGTREFDETADGWVRFALLVCAQAKAAGIAGFDVEIWNELTFGTHFLDINDYYYEPDAAPYKGDRLNEGGPSWELAKRTVAAVKRQYPEVRCIWGFSNTTFFHTPIEKLPPGTDGQSYHPYGTGTREFPRDEDYRDRPDLNLDGFTPEAEFRIPEGLAETFIKTESLMRLLNPEARHKHPPGVERFYHYMTEHGVLAAECGAKDAEAAWRLKTLCALRSFCLWLNKGVDVMHYFSGYDEQALGMGLLPPDVRKLPPDAKFDDVATPPLQAIRRLTRAFEGCVPLRAVQALQLDVTPVDAPRTVFEGPVPLRHQDVFAFLPFQASATRHIVAVYVATYDATRPMPEERYRLGIRGFAAVPRSARLLDPVTGRSTAVALRAQAQDAVEADVSVLDYPRLLVLDE
ncbi:MAG: hypothetical protein P4L84_08250 [Isosphaeraceae bacterium]|nr:hypothetical protein [Isosphaeraceae bacterium]